MWLITLNGGDVRSFQSLHQLPTLSLWRCRSRRACVRAYAHPHARICGRVCIHMRRRVYVHVHAYARAPVHAYMRTRMYAHACAHQRMRGWRVVMAVPRRVKRCLGRAYAPMRMFMHVHAYMHGRVCARPAVSVACTLKQVFWSLVHGLVCMLHRCVFYTNVHICDTLTAGCAHVCVCICVCIWTRVCMDACVRL